MRSRRIRILFWVVFARLKSRFGFSKWTLMDVIKTIVEVSIVFFCTYSAFVVTVFITSTRMVRALDFCNIIKKFFQNLDNSLLKNILKFSIKTHKFDSLIALKFQRCTLKSERYIQMKTKCNAFPGVKFDHLKLDMLF